MKFSAAALCSLFAATPAFAVCHNDPIQSFFPAFAASVALQEETAGEMVLLGYMNTDSKPEPTVETILMPKSEIRWPVVPNLTVFLREGGTVSYEMFSPEEANVTLRGDNGYRLSVYFVGPCWELRSVTDESM